MMCRDYHTLYGRPYTVLRYGIPYGPRMRDNCVAAAFFKRAFRGEPLRIDGDGLQERFFVYVEDLARAHVLALDPIAENRTFNLDGDEPVSHPAHRRDRPRPRRRRRGRASARPAPATSRPGSCPPTGPRDELGWIPRVVLRRGHAAHARLVRRRPSASTSAVPEPVTLED